MFYKLLIIFFFISINGESIETNNINEIPSYIKVCHKSNPKLNECVKQSIEQLRPKLIEGIPELLVPSCEPLKVPKISISQQAGAITLTSEYTDILISGPSKFHLKAVRVDPIKNRFRLRLWFPELLMTATYKIEGKLLMMPLKGTGRCQGNYTDVDATAALRAEKIMKNNEEHLRIKDMFVEFNIGGASVHLDDLFNGDPELGDAMNRFLNENWRTVAGELRPALEDTIGDILQGVANKVFSAYPINKLLPD